MNAKNRLRLAQDKIRVLSMMILEATQEDTDYIDNAIARFNQQAVPFYSNSNKAGSSFR